MAYGPLIGSPLSENRGTRSRDSDHDAGVLLFFTLGMGFRAEDRRRLRVSVLFFAALAIGDAAATVCDYIPLGRIWGW